MTESTVLPGATLGVMGGGQLGRMLVHAAQTLGYFTAVLDPDRDSPAGRVSHHHVVTDYLDATGLQDMQRHCSAITTEFENVPADALRRLAERCRVAPGPEAVAIAQDRALEKAHFARCGVTCAPHAVIETPDQLAAVADSLLPGVLKTARMGYDGKGQVRVQNRAELSLAWSQLKGVPCVLEQLLPLDYECSVILARGVDATVVHYRPQRNLHRNGILAVTEAFDGSVDADLAEQAVVAAQAIANGLNYVGVLCVEFFVLQAASVQAQALGRLVVNEIAPRPHNSGHYTLNACDVSQFELQVRSLTGLPLIQPRQHSPAIMLNLLGDLWFDAQGQVQAPPWAQVLAIPGAALHLYGKQQARPGRKMGHLNFTGPTAAQVKHNALQAARLLGLAEF